MFKKSLSQLTWSKFFSLVNYLIMPPPRAFEASEMQNWAKANRVWRQVWNIIMGVVTDWEGSSTTETFLGTMSVLTTVIALCLQKFFRLHSFEHSCRG